MSVGAHETATSTPRGREGYQIPLATRRMWREKPVREVTTEDGRRAWLVTGMAEVRTVLSDPRFARSEARSLGVRMGRAAIFDQPGILDLDPPEHSRLRRLVASAFSARRVRALRPRIQQITDDLLADLAGRTPPVDLNGAFCFPLPIAVICEILGVPYADRERFRGWSERIMSTTAYAPEEAGDALASLAGYIAGLVAAKRRAPDDSLLRALTAARDEQDRLSEEELVHLGLGLLVAGHETTANVLGKGLVALFDHPDQLAALRADPSTIPGAVEEVLRYVALGVQPTRGLVRATTRDVELGGVTIPAHNVVVANPLAANRDPRAFPDPDRLDLGRAEAADHVTFGHGPHHCLGAQLARMELEVAFTSLVRAFPTLRLAVPVEELTYREGMLITGLRTLPVTW